MSNLSFQKVGKVYTGGCRAVDDFSLEIRDGEFMVFTGHDGSGKSTLLRMVAGLEDNSSGDILIGGKSVIGVPSKARDVALVLPDYTLYPQLTVFDNLAYGLKHRKYHKEYIEVKVKKVAEMLSLEELLQRKPKTLTSLQRLRVALGRIIVREPKVVLFDEPLSNLDDKLRLTLRSELIKLHTRLGFTFLYATHDPLEALSLGTRIAVLKEGELQQVDIPQNLYDYPVNRYVADYFGSPAMNLFEATVAKENQALYAQFTGCRFELPTSLTQRIAALEEYVNTGKKAFFGIRPEDISLTDDENAICAKVETVESLGAETLLTCDLFKEAKKSVVGSPSQIVARVRLRSEVKAGDTVKLALDPARVQLFDGYTELSLLARDEGYQTTDFEGANFVPRSAKKESAKPAKTRKRG